MSRGSKGRETQEISDRGNQVCFGWSNQPERNSDRLTRQWWLWFPAAGHQTTPQTFDQYDMRNIAAISGLTLPSILVGAVLLAIDRELRGQTSGEAAATVITSGIVIGGLVLIIGCLVNIGCTIIAAKRKEPLWRISSLGIPLSIIVGLTLMWTGK